MKSVYSTNFKSKIVYTGNLTLQFTKITRRLQQFTRRLQAKKAGSQLDRNVVYTVASYGHSLNRKRPFAKKTGQVTKWGAVHKNHPHAKNTLALRKKYENGVGYMQFMWQHPLVTCPPRGRFLFSECPVWQTRLNDVFSRGFSDWF